VTPTSRLLVRTSAFLVSAALLTIVAGLGDSRPASAGQGVDGDRAHPPVLHDRDAKQWPPKDWQVFDHRMLVAYYGTANSGALGVLGETSPDRMTKRLRAAAEPFAHGGVKTQIVYELIASIADAGAGADGDYSHYVDDASVRRYVRAAKRNHALLVLDLQPGRAHFKPQAKHFAWALRKPWVGLALDPEWRMGPHQVPAQSIGHVSASEVNRVSAYLARLARAHDLPQKVFMVHQFRTDMVRNIERIEHRKPLATVQHVDGFGSREQKLATYHAVVRPRQFHQGFKLFYDEDTNLFRPRGVVRIEPNVQFVSYQ
jgi:hypothetical protein